MLGTKGSDPVCCAQVAAWPAHKKACKERQAAIQQAVVLQAPLSAQAQARRPSAPAAMTANQVRVCKKLDQHRAARNWRGIVALERDAEEVAGELRAARHPNAGIVYSILGVAYRSLSQYDNCHFNISSSPLEQSILLVCVSSSSHSYFIYSTVFRFVTPPSLPHRNHQLT